MWVPALRRSVTRRTASGTRPAIVTAFPYFIFQTAESSHARILAARRARAVQRFPHLEKQRAQGKPGARRTHSLACEIIKHTSVVTTGSPETPGLPCAMVLTVSFALSPVTGLSCHRSPVKVALHRLDASVGASGPRDFAVRVSAARLRRYPRPLHPAPNVRDDAYAPLIEAGCGES